MVRYNAHALSAIIPSAILGSISLVAVILRFIARRKTKARFATDDWLAVISLLFPYIYMGMAIYSMYCSYQVKPMLMTWSLSERKWRKLQSQKAPASSLEDIPQGLFLKSSYQQSINISSGSIYYRSDCCCANNCRKVQHSLFPQSYVLFQQAVSGLRLDGGRLVPTMVFRCHVDVYLPMHTN